MAHDEGSRVVRVDHRIDSHGRGPPVDIQHDPGPRTGSKRSRFIGLGTESADSPGEVHIRQRSPADDERPGLREKQIQLHVQVVQVGEGDGPELEVLGLAVPLLRDAPGQGIELELLGGEETGGREGREAEGGGHAVPPLCGDDKKAVSAVWPSS